jgi:hypothetical protein
MRPPSRPDQQRVGAMIIGDWVFFGVLIFSMTAAILALLADY